MKFVRIGIGLAAVAAAWVACSSSTSGLAASPGCEQDTDCEGSLVCLDGECVEPGGSTVSSSSSSSGTGGASTSTSSTGPGATTTTGPGSTTTTGPGSMTTTSSGMLGYCDDIPLCQGDGLDPTSGCLECAIYGNGTVAI